MKKTIAVLFMLIIMVPGCANDKVKPSADSLMTQSAISALDSIKNAYEKKDRSGIQNKTEETLSQQILQELSFDSSELSFTPKIVRISSDSIINVHVTWRGTWIVDGKTLTDRGSGVLSFQRESLKLVQIKGDNPFNTPSNK